MEGCERRKARWQRKQKREKRVFARPHRVRSREAVALLTFSFFCIFDHRMDFDEALPPSLIPAPYPLWTPLPLWLLYCSSLELLWSLLDRKQEEKMFVVALDSLLEVMKRFNLNHALYTHIRTEYKRLVNKSKAQWR